MKVSLYSVYDVKTTFAAPFIDVSDESAARGFHYAFSNNSGIMSFSPTDFRLYRVGEFDTATGVVKPCNPIEFVCDAVYQRGVCNEE